MIINYLCNADGILCCTTRYVGNVEALHHVITPVIIIVIIIIIMSTYHTLECSTVSLSGHKFVKNSSM